MSGCRQVIATEFILKRSGTLGQSVVLLFYDQMCLSLQNHCEFAILNREILAKQYSTVIRTCISWILTVGWI